MLMSLTARHTKAHKLPDLLDSLKNAKRRLCQRREWRALPLIGSVTATEVTGGGTHGWHPHFHTLMLIEATTEAEAIELVERLRDPWLACLKAFGLDGAGAAFDAQGAASAEIMSPSGEPQRSWPSATGRKDAMGGRLFNCSMMLRKLGTLSQASFLSVCKDLQRSPSASMVAGSERPSGH